MRTSSHSPPPLKDPAIRQDRYEQHIAQLIAHGLSHSVFVKVTDMLDNAGSLQHQYGHVKDAMIRRLSHKYLRPLEMFIKHFQHVQNKQIETVNDDLIDELLASLIKTRQSLIDILLDLHRLSLLD